jgi:hypothetical protein
VSPIQTLTDWPQLQSQRLSVELRPIQSEALKACARYPELAPATLPGKEVEHRIARVVQAARRGALGEVKHADLQLCLHRLIDERALLDAPALSRQILEEGKSRRNRSSLDALLRAVLATFVEGSNLTEELHAHVVANQSRLGERTKRFCNRTNFLEKGYGFRTFLSELRNASDVGEWFSSLGLVTWN